MPIVSRVHGAPSAPHPYYCMSDCRQVKVRAGSYKHAPARSTLTVVTRATPVGRLALAFHE